MSLPSIDSQDQDIENYIQKAKENGGYLMAEELDVHVFSQLAKRKMLAFALIRKNEEKDWQYELTDKGWSFKGFEKKWYRSLEIWLKIIGLLTVLLGLLKVLLG